MEPPGLVIPVAPSEAEGPLRVAVKKRCLGFARDDGQGGSYFTTFWSMAPKIDWPARSSISMRIGSQTFMKGVVGLPVSIAPRTRRSAMQEQPAEASRLATVPE